MGITPPPKLRRRPALIALGVALIALGGLAAAWLTTTAGNTQSVLAVRNAVERGTVVEPADLVVARINPDPALATVAETQRDQFVGKRAAVDLATGSLLTPSSVTDAVLPEAGQSLVGVALTGAQLPAQTLRAGDQVRIVTTPRTQDDPPADDPAAITATVVQAHPLPEGGQTVVDVTVPNRDADDLAARAATGRVALILDPRQR